MFTNQDFTNLYGLSGYKLKVWPYKISWHWTIKSIETMRIKWLIFHISAIIWSYISFIYHYRYLNGGILRSMEHHLLSKCHSTTYPLCLVEQKDSQQRTTTQIQPVTIQLQHRTNKHNNLCQVRQKHKKKTK